MKASTSASACSSNFCPRPEKTLMPLSSYGLCDAEMTTPTSNPCWRVSTATAGVGMTPTERTSPPIALTPRARARSIQNPDSRVSRPTSTLTGVSRRSVRTSAAPSRITVVSSSGGCPATPRTPSVPKSFFMNPI